VARSADVVAEKSLIVFGRVPFFFYALHVAVVHLIAIALAFVRWPRALFPPGYGFSLWPVYGVWIVEARRAIRGSACQGADG
jgi:hypothetical protein